MMDTPRSLLAPFTDQTTSLLTTFRRDGVAVGTPVHIAVEGDHAFFRTWDTTWKYKRLRNNPLVTLRPSTFRGQPQGPAIRARARRLEGPEARHAAELLTSKYPVLQRLVPVAHRLMGVKTVHFELSPLSRERDKTQAA
jgi:PPOX class probable F420-dependent enzyme